jgi:hypothetical protein
MGISVVLSAMAVASDFALPLAVAVAMAFGLCLCFVLRD